jgi:hypothetical protein
MSKTYCKNNPACDRDNGHDGFCSATENGLTDVFFPEETRIEGSGSARYPDPGTTDWTDRGKADHEP